MFENLSDVNDRKNEFVYLVSTFLYPNGHSVSDLSKRLDTLRDYTKRYDASIVGVVGKSNQVDTYGDFGVVLYPEEKDLLIAWDSDVFTPPENSFERRRFFSWNTGRIKKLDSLLDCGYYFGEQYGGKMGYNNLVLKGRKNNLPRAIVYRETEEGLKGKEDLSKLLPNVPQINLGFSWKEGNISNSVREKLSKKYLNSMFDFSPNLAITF